MHKTLTSAMRRDGVADFFPRDQVENWETARPVDPDDGVSLEDMYGCDPWDDENFGRHPASRER